MSIPRTVGYIGIALLSLIAALGLVIAFSNRDWHGVLVMLGFVAVLLFFTHGLRSAAKRESNPDLKSASDLGWEDDLHWPVSRYLREVLPSQPNGRLLIFFAKVNLSAGLVFALSLAFAPLSEHLAGRHVALFLCMPLLGFLLFVRDTRFDSQPWQRMVSGVFQLGFGLLPWAILIRDHVA